MIPELGHFALILAFCMALVLAVLPLVGAALNHANWMSVAAPAAWAQFLFVATAYAVLSHAFISHDFSLVYVASNSNRELPLVYRISGVWGAHEGSLMLWVLILNIWTVAVAGFSCSLSLEMRARVLGTMGVISLGFLAFALFTSNPFVRHFPYPPDGADLNPLLQDPGMAVHPPMLYMGYVGFSVPFAFAIAALLGGRLDSAWARWSRPWTAAAWAFLAIGITLGSWWAYYELGWGGWWFWDPVENASFMPWLAGTALLHSLAVTEKRGLFRSWTVLLAIMTFSLSLLGTFLVRSGVLTSVHAFASDPLRGVFILAFLAIVVGGSLTLYAWRTAKVRPSGAFSWLSRETLLLMNNVFLVVASGTILLGTIYPLILDALGLGKISVGPPYFNTVFVPLVLPLLLLIGIGPAAQWRRQGWAALARQLGPRFLLSVLVSGMLAFALPNPRFLVTFTALALAVWVITSSIGYLRSRIATRTRLGGGLRSMSRGTWGMCIAHMGVAVSVLGVALSSALSQERDVRMAPGDTQTLGGVSFQLVDVNTREGPNYRASVAHMRVREDGRTLKILYPEKRLYTVRKDVMTEAAIDSGFTRDLYVSLGEPLDEKGSVWAVRLYYKPFVSWIWLGGALMGLGGFLAASDRRYRATARRRLEKETPVLTSPAPALT